MFGGVPEKLSQNARRQKVARVGARGHLPQRAELRRRQLQGFADARRVPLRHAPAQVVGRQKRVDHVQMLDGHADVRWFGALGDIREDVAHAIRVARRRAGSRRASRTRGVLTHDGLVAVLVEHAPHELSRQELVLGAVQLLAARGPVHQVGDANGPVYAHRVRVPVELGERLQKRVQNLQRRRERLGEMKLVQHVQHQRLERVRADQRVVRAQQTTLVEAPSLDEHDRALEQPG